VDVAVETAIWKMTDAGPQPLTFSRLGLESSLEDMIVADPGMIGLEPLVIGRQVTTAFGGFVDVLGVDVDGRLHVVELKRDRTPRNVVAQTLDYAAWVADLGLDQVATLYAEHNDGAELEDAFAERFSAPLPDVFNPEHQLTIVASELDPASERIMEYLAERFDVPMNAVFFRHFTDGENKYLTRTWLLSADEAAAVTPTARRSKKMRPWNGRDFYVIQGSRDDGGRRWKIAHRYGLLSAGGGRWYWRPLRNLTPGKRVFAYVGGIGYVGVGVVTGQMTPAREATVEVDGRQLSIIDAPDVDDRFTDRARSEDDEITEMVVPVRWDHAVSPENAVSAPGLFASQVTVCKLRDDRTIETVVEQFGLTDHDT
jgi:hypothetical protein